MAGTSIALVSGLLTRSVFMNHRIPLYRRTHPLRWLARSVMVAALAALAQLIWRSVATPHARRVANRPEALPKRLQMEAGQGGQNQVADEPPAKAGNSTIAAS
jgi:hypothetical protein